ncbi:MAG: hypothetical protein KYX68_04580 [Flavobacterium sp.]|nr:hypothetical protein [Flavobacterium sp.]
MHKDIIKQLDEIVFHDVPVENILIKNETTNEIHIDFLLYNESSKDYQKYLLKFKNVIESKFSALLINKNTDFEIYSFDYSYKDFFNCKLTFLLGFGEPSFEIELKTENIELITKNE